MLLEGTVRSRTGLAWYKSSRVQLLAAPAHIGVSGAPTWSALVVDGVTLPYDQVARVRMDESALEFIVELKSRTPTAQDEPLQHLRMFTRSEFNLWREALCPAETSNPTLHMDTESTPSAVDVAHKWLADAEACI